MNARSYKTVFSKRLGALVAVGEHATSQGKANGASGPGASGASEGAVSALAGIGYVAALSASFAFVSLAWAAPATNALPTGGTVVQGAASMSQTANQLNIQQATQRAAINWQSFNIGAAATVNVAQPNAQAVLLNRVVGQSPSQIFGKLQANGHVILVNPNGVLFGKDGSVNAGGFTASTLNISDANFMAGNMVYERNGSTAGIQNLGNITAEQPGGYVALLGATVSNEGSITTKGGSVVMGAGETIKVPVSGTGRIKLELTPAAINASVSNSGSIVTEGGQVYMQALALNRAAAQIIQSGSIDTTGEQGGAVHLLADGGVIKVDGSIVANSKGADNKGGDIIIGRDEVTGVLAAATDVSGAKFESLKGFVETSGDELKFDGVSVMAKNWLLDPFNVNIDAASAAAIGTNLRTTSVTIQTTGSTLGVSAAGTGNITISSAITKVAPSSGTSAVDTTLKLIADNGIDVNAAIGTAAGAGKLNVEMIAKGQTNGKAVADMSSAERALSSGIRINSSINANGGDVTLTGTAYANGPDQRTAVGKGVHIHNSSSIDARNITITGTAENLSGNTSYGVVFQRFPTAATLKASGNIQINGTLKGDGNGNAVLFMNSGWGSQAPMISAGGKFTINAENAGKTNTRAALEVLSGMQVTALGDININAKTNNASENAIYVYSRPTTVWSNGLEGNFSLRSVDASGNATGNVVIQANQGGIVLNNNITPTLINGSLTTKTDIVGKNISIDNTGGNVDGTTGVISAGSGKATGTGINLADTRAITALGNLNIMGVSSGGGTGISSNAVLTAGGMVNLTGESVTGQGIFSAGAVKSNNASVSMIGRSTNAAGGAGVVTQGTVSAQTDIKLEGYSANTTNVQGLVVQNAVTSTAGDITVKGETKASNPGQRAVAITTNGTATNGSLNVANGKTINIHANTLYIAPTASVNAGTGTVNIQTLTSGNEILIGGTTANDGMGSGLTSQKLGIDNTELNRITAGKLVIGDTSSTGKITVSAATTTLANTGHVTLQTSGNIEVNAGLKVGDDGTGTATKNLTLNGAGASSSITQTAAIKAASLELLGTNATHTLTNTGNQVTTLAGNSKAINYVNGSALTLGAVNATPGVNATGDVSIATQTGNLTIAENVSTTATTATALVLNAGKSSAVGAAVGADTGGNILVSTGKTVSVGSGGTAQLMTGSITGDTSAAGLAAAGNFRYNSDETNTNYNTALSSGVNVIYREKPTLTVNVNNASKTYDGLTFTGGNGFTEVTPSGLKNGDGLTGATATAVYGGTAQNAKNVSSTPYTLSASESITGKSALGYGVTYNSGTLTVGKADLSVALADQTKTYDGTTAATLAPAAFTVKGVTVAGQTETASVNQTVAFYNDKNVLGASSVTANLAAGNFAAATGTDLNNYNLPTSVTGKGTITPRPLTIAPGSVATKTADGTTAATVTPGALSNLVGTETLAVAATGTFSDANAGNNKAVNAFYTLQNGANGGLASNYILALGKPGNPDTRMTGTILAAVNPVTPIAPVNNNTGSISRVRTVSGFGGAGAATGVLDDKAVTESSQVCSDVFPENCECQASVIPSIEICFAPKSVAATKEEK